MREDPNDEILLSVYFVSSARKKKGKLSFLGLNVTQNISSLSYSDLVVFITGFLGPVSKVHGGMHVTSSSYPIGELGFSGQVHFSGSELQKHGLAKASVTASPSEKAIEAHFSPANRVEELPASLSTARVLENDGGSSNMFGDVNKIIQVPFPLFFFF